MKMLVTIVFSILSCCVQGQGISVEASRKLAGNYQRFSIDNLGNIYVLTIDNQLKKYNVRGDSMGVFNDVRRFGKLTDIIAINPLRTLLYYKEFKTVIILDRLMNPVNRIDLRLLNLMQVKVVAPAYDNTIWIFDEQDARLKKIGEDGRVLLETADLRLVLDDAPSPQKIIDQDGLVYLYDAERGLYVFDYYGALKNKLAVPGLTDVQVLNQSLAGLRNGQLVVYQPTRLAMDSYELPQAVKVSKQVFISTVGLYALNETGIWLYPYTYTK